MNISDLIYNQVLYNYKVKKLTSKLLQFPFLINNPAYQYFYQQLLAKKTKIFSAIPFRLIIENTNICNADCCFCPHKYMLRKTGNIPMDLFRKLIDQCRQLKINYITVYGFGEPLLDKYFFDRIIYAKTRGIKRVTTNTNAMFLDKDKVKKLLASGLDEIFISFDAATASTYQKIRPGLNFKTVENNILYLIKERKSLNLKKPEIILSYVECNENKNETKFYIKKWEKLVDHVSISFMHNWTGKIKEGQNNFPEQRDPCRLLWTDMVISWNGDVPICCQDYENKIILGNVYKESITDIWSGKKMAKIRKFHQRLEFNQISLCRNCTYNFHHKSPWWVAK